MNKFFFLLFFFGGGGGGGVASEICMNKFRSLVTKVSSPIIPKETKFYNYSSFDVCHENLIGTKWLNT